MTFLQRVKDLAERSKHASETALTEEATKTSVILPLLQALGFDIFNLNEVTPEYVADVGLKKGEKVDFALRIDGRPQILVEVKPISMPLGNAQFSQLYRYFAVSGARLAILTNGREIWFFSDIDERNRMDKKPFLVFDLQAFDEARVSDLAQFQKEGFDIERILDAASGLKFVKAAAQFLKSQIAEPSDDFARLVAKNLVDGSVTKSVLEQIRPVVSKAFDELVRERIQDKLSMAFKPDSKVVPEVAKPTDDGSSKEIETTEEELQAFYIVRAITAKVLPLERITIRDSKTYCSVFVDDNNRKPICRFYFNAKSFRAIGIFDSGKVETRHTISRLNDIYDHSAAILECVSVYQTS